MRRITLLAFIILCAIPTMAAMPGGAKLPLVIWDVTFNNMPPGAPPPPLTKAQLEASGGDDWKRIPLHTYTSLDFLMRTRTAVVEKAAFGLQDQPVIFRAPEGAEPQWGPRMFFAVPQAMQIVGTRYRLTLDVARGQVSQMGGFCLYDILSVQFRGDGAVLARGAGGVEVELVRYQAQVPLHFTMDLDVATKTITVMVNDQHDHAITVPWERPTAPYFHTLRLDAILPGGYGWPGDIAFDNIKLTLEDTVD